MNDLYCTYCGSALDAHSGMIYCSDPSCGAVWWSTGEVDRPGVSAEAWEEKW